MTDSSETSQIKRRNNRQADQLRSVEFLINYTKWAEGSVLAKFGDTHVLCNVTLEERLPPWLRYSDNPHGWVTAEYALLPRSTQKRVDREQRWPKGRTQEISRLIGRSLRMAVDLQALGQRQLLVDCDVLQADGGTRTTAINGAWVALVLALRPLIKQGVVSSNTLQRQIGAISVGLVYGVPLLDLDYKEDVAAAVDFNVVMTAAGEVVEMQGTAEEAPFARSDLDRLVALAAAGIEDVIAQQLDAIGGSFF